jgi:hypothetical protein
VPLLLHCSVVGASRGTGLFVCCLPRPCCPSFRYATFIPIYPLKSYIYLPSSPLNCPSYPCIPFYSLSIVSSSIQNGIRIVLHISTSPIAKKMLTIFFYRTKFISSTRRYLIYFLSMPLLTLPLVHSLIYMYSSSPVPGQFVALFPFTIHSSSSSPRSSSFCFLLRCQPLFLLALRVV